METLSIENANALGLELDWFCRVLNNRLEMHFDKKSTAASIFDVEPPDLSNNQGHYAGLLRHYQADAPDRLVIMLALVPHIRPQLLDLFFTKNETFQREFTEFGGIKKDSFGGFMPTVETALFILAGENLEQRFLSHSIFDPDHFLRQFNVIELDRKAEGAPIGTSPLKIGADVLSLITTGTPLKPDFGPNFPAKRTTTKLDWDELVLHPSTMAQIAEIKAYLKHGDMLTQTGYLERRIKPGYRSLFVGPTGTGKTLTATLLGQLSDLDVYRIDLSLVISKYIGETEQNLEKIFSQAEHKNWILFFDEADALFGKRTQISDSHDRYANQEVSYLLQRIEEFPGIIILATNLMTNLDDAFLRRFQSIIHFPMPGKEERLALWKKGFSETIPLSEEVDLKEIAAGYELSGGLIVNIIQHCTLMALDKEQNTVTLENLEAGIRKEYRKEGRTVA